MGEGVEVELSKTFSFGKRGANISLARSESELTEHCWPIISGISGQTLRLPIWKP